jgi:hypothetical protein
MSGGNPVDFHVEFGRIARTIRYVDSHGVLTFTFDTNSERGVSALFLEIGDDGDRSAAEQRYDIAVAHTKQFLEGQGFEVEIFDPRTIDRAAADAEVERNRADAVASGVLTMSPLRKPMQQPCVESWWSRLFRWFS